MVGILILVLLIVSLFLWEILRYKTPSLSELSKNLEPFSSALVFNYSKQIDNQMSEFSQNLGLESHSIKQEEESSKDDLGANGFVVFDVRPVFSKLLFEKLDHVLSDALDFLEQASDNSNNKQAPAVSNENSISYNYFDESPFATPLSQLLEEIWNGKTFVIGGATQFHLNLEDVFHIAMEPYFKNIFSNKNYFFRDLIIKNSPVFFQDALKNHAIHFGIIPSSKVDKDNIHSSDVVISLRDVSDFMNSFCSSKINPWDLCGRLSIDRDKFRMHFFSLFGLIDDSFKVDLKIYWAMLGKNFVYSNQKDFVLNILKNRENQESNLLVDVAASGDDFLFSNPYSSKYLSLSSYFDMIKLQNEFISFIELLRNNSQVVNDYFTSPKGYASFLNVEKRINDITGFSQKSSIMFRTDGDFLYPELRLYSPSQDLFLNDGTELSPEFVKSLRVFLTQSISFGHYLLPKGLVPIPTPTLKRNGRWTILRTSLSVKAIAPYMESIDPYVHLKDAETGL